MALSTEVKHAASQREHLETIRKFSDRLSLVMVGFADTLRPQEKVLGAYE